nr:ATPase, T2SS/T4P/T4SS family [uncultured Noviherbaspirillum sp.]
MLDVELFDSDGSRRLLQVPDESIIGKGAQNEIRLDSWRVGREHARLFSTKSGVLIEDLGGFGGVLVNGSRIDGQYGPLTGADMITIGPCRMRVLDKAGAAGAGAMPSLRHPALPHTLPAAQALPEAPQSAAQPAMAALASASTSSPAAVSVAAAASPAVDLPARQREFEWRKTIHTRLLETMDLRRQDVHGMSDQQLRLETETLVRQIMRDADAEIPRELDRALLMAQVINEAIALGPLEELLADDSVSEIMVNRYDEIYVERAGRLHRHPMAFTGDRAVMGVIERIVAPLGRRIDESSPMVDARLKDGSRVNAIIPPLALKGPCLTIRKFARHKLGAGDLVRFGAISPQMASFLETCVVGRKNIVVSGGTGSGKTTLLNILSNFIPGGERVVTVEDAAELKLSHEHLISLESRPANVEGKGAVPIRELVKNTLRMRPDRIVVGECRGAEALDMLQAMNTGHEGSLTTLHANTPRDGLARLETMVLMAGMDLPLVAIREQIASAVHIVVQQTRFACGSRKVTSITEISGMESGKIQMQELFRFVSQGYRGADKRVAGYFTGCDMVPTFYEELQASGAQLDMAIFRPVEVDGAEQRNRMETR